MVSSTPASGGSSLISRPFPDGLPLARPTIPDVENVAEEIRQILASGLLTNGPRVRELEDRAAAYLGVRHCVAVASCTAGLMLLLRVADLTGDVVLPSFTFAATAHAVAWNDLRPVFADIDPETLTLSAAAAERACGVRTLAILATHTYGAPCDIEGLAAVARRNGIRLFFDAAHAFGSTHGGVHVGGFGDAEVFSFSPTKVLVAAEGGMISTNDDVLAERCRIGRDYGNPGDYDCRFVGLNARLSEIHAAVGLASMSTLEERIALRNAVAEWYREALGGVPGLSFPRLRHGDRSTYKDFTVIIDPEAFGIDADGLAASLASEGIETRRYYRPPVHTMRAYRFVGNTNGGLPATEAASASVLTLPLWEGMTERDVALVADALGRARGGAPAAGHRLIRLD